MTTAAIPPRGPPQQTMSARAAPVSGGSQTQTQPSFAAQQPVLRLRGTPRTKSDRRIQWAKDVVDNEGLGRKSSKVCCIYHAPKPVDESSDESSSDNSSDDDSDVDDGGARPAGGRLGNGRYHNTGHEDGDHCEHSHGHGKGKARARSPNAYEKMPKAKEAAARPKA